MDEVSFLKDFIEIYSPSGSEGPAARYLIDKMRELGFRTELDSWGNAWGHTGSGKPKILLCGHIDTVPGVIPVKVEGGVLHGRGSVDAKSALAAMVFATHRFSESRLPGTVMVVGVVGEEAEGAGMAAGIQGVLKKNIGIDYAIFGEPTGINRITIGYRGRIGIRIVCLTEESHVASPSSANSIEGIFQALKRIHGYFGKHEIPSDGYNSLVINPTLIQGGRFHNITPARCELFLDIRVPPSLKNEQIIDKIREITEALQHHILRFQVDIVDSTPPYEAPKNSAIVRALIRAILTETNLKPQLTHKTGTGDMNILGNILNIPVATYGPGDGRLSHTAQEALSIEEYKKSISIYYRAIEYISKRRN